MNANLYLNPVDQIALHLLTLLRELRQGRVPRLVFHLGGILRAVNQLVL